MFLRTKDGGKLGNLLPGDDAMATANSLSHHLEFPTIDFKILLGIEVPISQELFLHHNQLGSPILGPPLVGVV